MFSSQHSSSRLETDMKGEDPKYIKMFNIACFLWKLNEHSSLSHSILIAGDVRKAPVSSRIVVKMNKITAFIFNT